MPKTGRKSGTSAGACYPSALEKLSFASDLGVDMSELRSLSIVVPSYNARALLRRALRTVGIAAPEAEIIVVDGASHDGSADMVRAEFPHVQVLDQPNHGFAHAVNRGLEAASRSYLLLLNSDLFVTRAALETMVARLATDPKLGAVAPVLLNEDGSRQHVFGTVYWPNWMPIHRPTRVPMVSGACLMTRRDVLRSVGGLDENFFLYNEEWDWCARLWRAGFHVEIVPAEVVHVGGGSTHRSPELLLEEQRGFLYFWHKHGPKPLLEAFRLAMLFEGWSKSRIDPRPQHRAMWKQLESLTRRQAYLESPFPLSGRGDTVAQAFWPAMEAAAPPVREVASEPAASERPRREAVEPLPMRGGRRIERDRDSVVVPFRRVKIAGAAG